MSALLLDASTILAAFDTDDIHHKRAKAILADTEIMIATLDLARYEIVNVAIRAWRAHDKVALLLEAIDRIEEDGGVVVSDTGLLTKAAELAEKHSISAYDAAYVAASSTAGRTLVSCDERDLLSKGLAVSPEQARKPPEDAADTPSTV